MEKKLEKLDQKIIKELFMQIIFYSGIGAVLTYIIKSIPLLLSDFVQPLPLEYILFEIAFIFLIYLVLLSIALFYVLFLINLYRKMSSKTKTEELEST